MSSFTTYPSAALAICLLSFFLPPISKVRLPMAKSEIRDALLSQFCIKKMQKSPKFASKKCKSTQNLHRCPFLKMVDSVLYIY